MSCTDRFGGDQTTTTTTTKMTPSWKPGLLLLLQLSNCIIGLMAATAASITSVQNQQDLIDYEQQQQTRNNQLLVQASPIEISANDSSSSSSSGQLSNYQLVSQNSRFRVNVSNVCEKNHMKVSIRLNRPFYGLIHAKDKRKKVPCFVEGNGDQLYTFDISFTLLPADPAYCGMMVHNHQVAASWTRQQQPATPTSTTNQSMLHGSHQQQQQQQQQQQPQETLSLALVVRLHKTIEFSDDRYFLLSCPNRCSRSDCSTTFSSQDMHQERRGFVASDSILSPVFRSSIGASQDKQLLLRQSAAGETSASCDMMIDLKFQWLVKLCWILIGLIGLMFCTIFYLCVSSPAKPSSRGRERKSSSSLASTRERSHYRTEKHQATSRKSNTSQSQSSDQSTSYMAAKSSADTSESLATTGQSQGSNSWTTSDQQQQQHNQMDKLRENNHYLANRQHLLLTDFLATKSAMEEYDQQHQSRQIIGRADDTFGNSRQFFNPLPRRRSIGGSVAMLNCLQGTETLPTSNHHQRSDQLGARLDPKHKLKSKSQTTIYYEQGQDPFKAVPFDVNSYVGSGYPPPEGVHRPQLRPYSFMDQVQHPDANGNFIHHDANAHWSANYEPQSMPMMTDDHKASDIFASDFQANQSWQATQTSTVEAPEPPIRHHQQPPPDHLSNSQFDPQNNSLQLIELIQSKHREQMAQANRTAASIRTNQATSTINHSKKPMPKPILTTSQRQANLVNNRPDQQWR